MTESTPNKKQKPVRIGTVIETVLNNYRRDINPDVLKIWDVWDASVGDAVAGNARPDSFQERVLQVHVSSSAWLQELRLQKSEIIARVNHAIGKEVIEDIKFRIGSL